MTSGRRPRWVDAEPGESDVLRTSHRAPGCPPPELVFALRERALPEGLRETIAAHVAACPLCEVLQNDMDQLPGAGLTGARRDAIRERVLRDGRERSRRTWAAWLHRPAVLASAIATVAIVLMIGGTRRLVRGLEDAPAPALPPATLAAARPEPPLVFRVEKLPVRLPEAEIVWRGQAGRDPTEAQELAAALEPYDRDDFPEAARRLAAFTARWPLNDTGHLYHGVAELLAGHVEDAVTPLRTALRVAERNRDTATDAAWYLALAYHRLGQPDLQSSTLEWLCLQDNLRAGMGCAALLETARHPGAPGR